MKDTKNIVKKYLSLFPEDGDKIEVLQQQIQLEEDLYDRKNFTGHVAVNAFVINSNNEVLTIFHNFLQRYLQPGGHVDASDATILAAALRELQEETGIQDVQLLPWHVTHQLPVLIESHRIPKNPKKNEEAHWHHGFSYVFTTDSPEVTLQLEEVSGYKWNSIKELVVSGKDTVMGQALTRLVDLKLIIL